MLEYATYLFCQRLFRDKGNVNFKLIKGQKEKGSVNPTGFLTFPQLSRSCIIYQIYEDLESVLGVSGAPVPWSCKTLQLLKVSTALDTFESYCLMKLKGQPLSSFFSYISCLAQITESLHWITDHLT